jgi:hypothetical protein
MQRFPICLLAAASLFAGAVSAQTTVLFVGNAKAWGSQANSGDGATLTFLRSRYGTTNVTYLDTEPNGITSSEVLGYDVVVLSSTPSSSRYRGILHNSPAPIVNMEEAVAGNRGGEFSVTTGRLGDTAANHKIVIKTKHPITAGFAVNSTVQIMTGTLPGQQVWWCTGAQATGSVSLATDDTTATNLFLTYVEAGGTLLDTTKAPCRRVMFGFTDRSFNSFTAAGKKLFGQAVDWAAAGCCAQTSNYGQGLAGTNGIPTLTTNARPVYGTTVNILMSNSSGVASVGLIVLSQTRASVPFLGGTLLTNPTFLGYVTLPAGGLTLPAPIPDLSALCPVVPHLLVFYAQLLQIDSAAPAGVSFSPGMRLEIGR